MITTVQHRDKKYSFDLSKPIDIIIPLQSGEGNLTAWYCDFPRFEPVMTDKFTGSVKLGGAVNFKDIYFNPHGHGTHSECLGHIAKEDYYVNECISFVHQPALVQSFYPEELENGDFVIMPEQIANCLFLLKDVKVLILRTLPNETGKTHRQYSNSNPPYLHPDAMKLIVNAGIEHLMIDTPSVDREEDAGKLEGHHIFWNYPENPRINCSITELIFVSDAIPDGLYFLQLFIANFKNDAAPCRPILYEMTELS